MCALSINDEPPPEPGKPPTTEGRPGTGSTTETSSPASPSQEETKAAMTLSPDPDGTRSGFTDSIASSSQISSCRSSRSVHARRMETLERTEAQQAAEQPETFQPKDVLNQ